MLFLLIFPILVSGFVACHIHPVHSYKLHRYEGQYLYLKSAELGLKCFGLALVVAITSHYVVPDSITICSYDVSLSLSTKLESVIEELGVKDDTESVNMTWFFILSLLTYLSAYLIKGWGLIGLRRRFGSWNTKVFVIGKLLEDSPLDNLLFNLSLQKGHVMLMMSDRKVYVGSVISLGEPSETSGMDQDITIMPVMSGYRDKDDLRVSFNTFYDEVDSAIFLSLRQEAIISATEFDFQAYEKWNHIDNGYLDPLRGDEFGGAEVPGASVASGRAMPGF